MSDSPRARSWLARELSIQSLYPNWLIAVAPGLQGWESLLDDGAFRVLRPGAGLVARLDQWFAPLPRPAEPKLLGQWVPFDPLWLMRTVADHLPMRGDIVGALGRCTRTVWDAPWYQSFVGPRVNAAQDPIQETLLVKDWEVGMVSIHVGVGGRVLAVGYLDRSMRGGG